MLERGVGEKCWGCSSEQALGKPQGITRGGEGAIRAAQPPSEAAVPAEHTGQRVTTALASSTS